MIPKSVTDERSMTLWFLLLFATFSAASTVKRSSAAAPQKRTIFPGPVAPEDTCPASPAEEALMQEKQNLRERYSRLESASGSVSGDRGVLLLQSAKNLVRNRGFFLSLALQMQKGFAQFREQPGILYYYVSAASALFASSSGGGGGGGGALVSAGVFFDADKHYPNWYRNVWFNQTMARFAPRAVRGSNPYELSVSDYGALSRDYTSPAVGNGLDDVYSGALVWEFQRQNSQGEVSHGSVYVASSEELRSTDVYRSCGQEHSDRWLTTLAFTAVEVLPRYTAYRFLPKPRRVAAATVDLDVSRLVSEGLPLPVASDHSLLTVSQHCPGPVPPSPFSGHLGSDFFRSYYPQSFLALRLAHSLSAFLQNLDVITEALDYEHNGITYGPYQPIPDTPSGRILADAPMSDTLLEAEVLATLLADPRIKASGVFFEREQGVDSDGIPTTIPRKAFQAWRGDSGPMVADLSSSAEDPNPTLSNAMHQRWHRADADQSLQMYKVHAGIRSSKEGGGVSNFTVDPLEYRAVPMSDGIWTPPYLRCDRYVNSKAWVVSYATPVFGPSVAEPGKLILRGVVTVDVAANI